MTKIGVAHSKRRTAHDAGVEASTLALQQLEGQPADLVLVFANPGYDQQVLLSVIREQFGPRAIVSGCSSEGVIYRGGCDESPCVVNLMAIASDRIRFDAINVGNYAKDPARCGQAIAARVGELGPERAKAVFVFPDGVTGDCTAMLRALQHALPFSLPVAGGAAGDLLKGDPRHVLTTYQYLDQVVHTDTVSAVIVGGDVELDVEVSHGCTPLGLTRTVTRVEGGWVHEVDGRPAWEVFKEYLDGDTVDLMSADIVHLCIGEPLDEAKRKGFDSDLLIRTPLVLAEDKKALFFPGGLQLGNTIQFTRRDPDEVGASAKRSATRLAERHGQRPTAMFQFDCAGRGYMLFGERTAEIAIRPLQDTIGDVPWIGFHTYGEIAPIAGEPFYQNYTVVLCALYETGLDP
jgi:hypothetical protein